MVPASLANDAQEVSPPHFECLSDQVINGYQEPVIRATESNASVEQIDYPDGIVDHQE